MAVPPTSSADSPLPHPAPNGGASLPRTNRLWSGLVAPFLYARRQPIRFVGWLTAFILGAGIAGAVVGLQWFQYHLRSARVAADRWHNAEASNHLASCRQVAPNHPEVLLLTSRIARRTADWTAAETALDQYATRHGTDESLAFERVLLRAHRGEVDEVAAVLRARLEDGGPTARLVREATVHGLLARYRYVGAHQVLTEWQQETPDDPLAVLLQAKFVEGQMGYDEAVTAYRRTLDLDPDLPEARLRLAQLLVTRRRGEEALAETTILRERLPEVAAVRIVHARALALQGRAAEARAEIDASLARYPDDPEALAERGSLALVAGDETAAAADLERAVSLDPGNIPARSQYALALARSDRQAESQHQYALVKQLQADMDRSLEIIRGPLQRNPNDPDLCQELGEIAHRAGQVREALRWYDEALAHDSNHLATHRSLTVLYRQLDNPVLAARHRAIAQRLGRTAPPSEPARRSP